MSPIDGWFKNDYEKKFGKISSFEAETFFGFDDFDVTAGITWRRKDRAL